MSDTTEIDWLEARVRELEAAQEQAREALQAAWDGERGYGVKIQAALAALPVPEEPQT